MGLIRNLNLIDSRFWVITSINVMKNTVFCILSYNRVPPPPNFVLSKQCKEIPRYGKDMTSCQVCLNWYICLSWRALNWRQTDRNHSQNWYFCEKHNTSYFTHHIISPYSMYMWEHKAYYKLHQNMYKTILSLRWFGG